MYLIAHLSVDMLIVMCYSQIAMAGLTKTYKYRAYCHPRTAENARRHLDLTRELYNVALDQRRTLWRQYRKSIHRFEQTHQLVELKAAYPEFKAVGSHVLQEVIHRLDRAFQDFFHRCKDGETPGYPRFKGYDRWNSLVFPDHAGWKLKGRYLKVSNVGAFKLKLSRPLEGEIRTMTLKRDGMGKWYAYIVCRNVPLRLQPKTGKAIGIDLGLSSFLTTSEGEKVENPRHFKHGAERLKITQQRFARKMRGSSRRKEAKRQVIKAHAKIRRQRRDFHFRLALSLVKLYDLMAVEDLRPSEMNSWRALNRAKSDVAWSQFLSILAFKAEEAGKRVARVNPRGTTKTCSACGAVKDMPLKERIYSCPCGLELDRDVNAAKNILARAGPAGKSTSHGCLQSVVRT